MGNIKTEAASGNSRVISTWPVRVKEGSMQGLSAGGIPVIRRQKAVTGGREISKRNEIEKRR